MRVCLINNLYPPYHRGGAEVVVENIVNGLKQKNHDVFIITTKPICGTVETRQCLKATKRFVAFKHCLVSVRDTRAYRFFPLNLFSIYHINKFKGFFGAPLRLTWHAIDMFNILSCFKLKKILKQEKPDVVMTHNLMGLGFLIPRLIKKMKIKHIQTMHDVQLAHPTGLLIKGQENNFLNRFFLSRWWQKLTRQLFASPDVVIFPSSWLKEFYLSRDFFKDSKSVVLHNPAHNIQITNHKSSSDFLFVGQIEQHKGVLFLIKTFNSLITNHKSPITLHIVGQGTQLNQAKRLVIQNPHIKLHGRLPNPQVLRLYSKTDCLVVPSLCYENSPTVIYESLSCGIPVIASNLGGIGELIKPGENGWLFEAGNSQELLKTMQKVINLSPQDRSTIRQNCLHSIKEYSLDNYIEKLLGLC